MKYFQIAAFVALLSLDGMFAKTSAVLVDNVASLDGNWTVHTAPWPFESEAVPSQYLHSKNTNRTFRLCAPSPAGATLRDLAMDRMLLFPPNSSMAFIPAAFFPPVQPGSSFSMTNCTVKTLCNTLAAYRNAFLDTTSANTLAVSQPTSHCYCWAIV